MNREVCIYDDQTFLNTDFYLYLLKMEKENQELNKENDRLAAKLNKNKILQNEFIKYLEDEIKACELTCDLIFNHNKEMKIYKEVLSKYKEIIGDKDEI